MLLHMSFVKSNAGTVGLIAGVLLIIVGGVMGLIGVFAGDSVYEGVRWTDANTGYSMGTANATGYLSNTTLYTPVDTTTEIVYCNATAITADTNYTLAETTGALVLEDLTNCESAAVTITYSYEGESNMTTVYNKFMKAMIICAVALIVIGAGIIMRTLFELQG